MSGEAFTAKAGPEAKLKQMQAAHEEAKESGTIEPPGASQRPKLFAPALMLTPSWPCAEMKCTREEMKAARIPLECAPRSPDAPSPLLYTHLSKQRAPFLGFAGTATTAPTS